MTLTSYFHCCRLAFPAASQICLGDQRHAGTSEPSVTHMRSEAMEIYFLMNLGVEVQAWGVMRLVLWSSWSCGWPSAPSVFPRPFSVSAQVPFSYKDASQIGLGSNPVTSFELGYLVKTPSLHPSKQTQSQILGTWSSTWVWGRRQ